jgi:hypothetical protein
MRGLVLEGRGHPAGKDMTGAVEQLPRLLGAGGEAGQHLVPKLCDAIPVHFLITTCLLIV